MPSLYQYSILLYCSEHASYYILLVEEEALVKTKLQLPEMKMGEKK